MRGQLRSLLASRAGWSEGGATKPRPDGVAAGTEVEPMPPCSSPHTPLLYYLFTRRRKLL